MQWTTVEWSHDFGMDVDMLVDMDVEPLDAQRYMFKLTQQADQITFHELYGRGGPWSSKRLFQASLSKG